MEAISVAPWTLLKWCTGQLAQAGTLDQTQQFLLRADGELASLDEIHRRWLAAYLDAIR